MIRPHLGFEYERKVASFLKKSGLVAENHSPAGSVSSRPDILLSHDGTEAGCELKMSSSASAGSIAFSKEAGEWKVSSKNKGKDRDIMRKLFSSEVLAQVESQWTGRFFPDIYGELDPRTIEKYYVAKGCYYMNIGTHGLYSLSRKNPFSLKIPRLSSSCEAYWRARFQSKKPGKTQFTLELGFTSLLKSQFNLGPLNKTGVFKPHLANLQCFKGY